MHWRVRRTVDPGLASTTVHNPAQTVHCQSGDLNLGLASCAECGLWHSFAPAAGLAQPQQGQYQLQVIAQVQAHSTLRHPTSRTPLGMWALTAPRSITCRLAGLRGVGWLASSDSGLKCYHLEWLVTCGSAIQVTAAPQQHVRAAYPAGGARTEQICVEFICVPRGKHHTGQVCISI